MIGRFLEIWPVAEKIITSMKYSLDKLDQIDFSQIRDIQITEKDIEASAELMEFLKPFYEICMFLQINEESNISFLLPLIQNLLNHLKKPRKFLIQASQIALKDFENRWSSFGEDELIACILDPRLKDLAFLDQENMYEKQELYSLVRKKLPEIAHPQMKKQENSGKENKQNTIFAQIFSLKEESEKKDELDKYLQMSVPDISNDRFNPLQ